MKDAQGSVSTTTNIDSGSAVEMTIHSGAIGKLMAMFSNQYSDAALAVVREYFCNGDDARIAAGSTRPTEVFLPTDLNPEILVRDYGVGLDRDGLVNTFATYGLSTKDDSNDQTGGFGIGSKAAFTLGQQFTVTGFKDGVKTVVNFALNAKGIGEVDVRFEGPTSEPNGVLVQVGVPNVANMRAAAERFFLNVPKGLALVDGVAPAHLSDTVEFTRFNDEVRIVKDGLAGVRLQMGPVVYRVSRSILESVAARLDGLPSQSVAHSLANWGESDSVLMTVPMGDVNIAPSREDLRDTDPTVNRIASVVQGISDYIVNDVQAQVDAAPSRYAAMQTLHSALAVLKGFKVAKKAFTYGGIDKPFKNDVDVAATVIFISQQWKTRGGYTNTVVRDIKHTVDHNRAAKTLVITGVDIPDIGKVQRYAKRFLESANNGENTAFEFIIVTPDLTGAFDWFEWGVPGGATTWTLDDYRAALRGLRDSNPRTKTEPSYTTGWNETASRDLDDRDLLTDIISWDKPLVIFTDSSNVNREIVALVEEKYTPVVLLAQQSENALRKRVEADGSVEIFEGDWQGEARAQIVADVKAEVAPPTDDERVALGAAEWLSDNSRRRRVNGNIVDYVENWRRDLIESFGGLPTPLAHPLFHDVTETEDLARLIADDLTEERKDDLQRLRRWCGVEFEAIKFTAEDTVSMIEAFPLLRAFDNNLLRRNVDFRRDVVAYINSKA